MEVTYARLRVTDPEQWRALALDWRALAATAGHWAAALSTEAARLRTAWRGAAADAATEFLARLRQRLLLFRVLCWATDQALSEFAAALARARELLARARENARAHGLVIGDDGQVAPPRQFADPAAPLVTAYRAAAVREAVGATAEQLTAALTVAATADALTAARLAELARPLAAPADPGRPPDDSPAAVRAWWESLNPAQRRWLTVTGAEWLGRTDGIPAADRDLANRLRLADLRADLAASSGAEWQEQRKLRESLGELSDRLERGEGPRAYLLGFDPAGDGRAVVALGDPDRAAAVLTQVPGMTADLASYGDELARAERVAVRATERDPSRSTSAVLWLDYNAPDFVDQAALRGPAESGAPVLRRFQEGLRATGEGQLTVLGHSYGSLVVGTAAATPGLAADRVVFVGSPGVGADSVDDLRVPADRVWSTTSRTDVIQYAPISPIALAKDLGLARALPVAGTLIGFGLPEDELWHGRNPADPGFGARVFDSQTGAGHLGYWDRGGPALDALADLTLGREVVHRSDPPR